MNDAIYSYVKKRIEKKLNDCVWEDRIGDLFRKNIMPEISSSIDGMHDTAMDTLDFIREAEQNIEDEESYI